MDVLIRAYGACSLFSQMQYSLTSSFIIASRPCQTRLNSYLVFIFICWIKAFLLCSDHCKARGIDVVRGIELGKDKIDSSL